METEADFQRADGLNQASERLKMNATNDSLQRDILAYSGEDSYQLEELGRDEF